MKNVLKILARDILRLVKAPAALVVVIVLVILPSAYTWYNVIGFWDPYGNTGNLRVCVANEDAGASSELMGDIDVGQMIVDELRENTQMDWQFMDEGAALAEVESGEAYAAFVIPSDFSSKLLTIITPDFDQPFIAYYVNEKIGPVVPKITDTGATTLDDTVNSAFVSAVSNVIAEKFDDTLQASEERIASSRSEAASLIAEGIQACSDARSAIAEERGALSTSSERLGAAESAMGTVRQDIAQAQSSLASLSGLAVSTQEAIDGLAAAIAATDAAATLEKAVEDLKAAAPGSIPSVIEGRQAAIAAAKADLDSGAAAAVSALTDSAARVSATLDAQGALVDQVGSLLGRAKTTTNTAVAALDSSSALLESLEGSLRSAYDSVMSMEGATAITDLLGEDGLDAAAFADFMAAPTRIVTEKLYPLGSYGAAMAPLFMNLTLWIGAFMLMVVLRQEADAAGIRNLTSSQRYLGRFSLFAILVVLQAIVCCLGLFVIGVHPVSAGALILASAVASLAYLSIIYALSVTMQHLGMGICVMLVFLQIPGATGLYPLEMTPEFFQAVYPLFPFTYGINAMREAICGFYGTLYAQNLGALVLFFAIFLALGLILRPLLANVNRMTAREIRDSGIFNSEDGEIPARRYRFYQIMRALSDRPEYREALERRKARLDRMYPSLIKWTAIMGVTVPVVLTLVLTLTAAEKVVLLSLWLAWIIFVFMLLIMIESLRFSLDRQLRLYQMDGCKLRGLYQQQHAVSGRGSDGPPSEEEPPLGGASARSENERAHGSQKAPLDEPTAQTPVPAPPSALPVPVPLGPASVPDGAGSAMASPPSGRQVAPHAPVPATPAGHAQSAQPSEPLPSEGAVLSVALDDGAARPHAAPSEPSGMGIDVSPAGYTVRLDSLDGGDER